MEAKMIDWVIGIVAIFVTIGLAVFGWGFSRWANVMDRTADALDDRLKTMERVDKARHDETQAHLKMVERELHSWKVCAERRLTRLETLAD